MNNYGTCNVIYLLNFIFVVTLCLFCGLSRYGGRNVLNLVVVGLNYDKNKCEEMKGREREKSKIYLIHFMLALPNWRIYSLASQMEKRFYENIT